eukprot:Protomagalhaensia_sp_Gyna_25__2318@NODE_2276_length_1178_cov_16_594381_g1885_i0_p1_GENE_NODE_2276_length_1178_cov_16_594381_g1885_i0NODE_2276_length_1178_cov_16_594381_g1885_i0_p1_ORF_typecomplete_len123_score12_01Lyx_isomer/PF07385_12/0_092Lyx_isomer/PF07385_12/1e03_NODE_2276_length_1178_cov_16_594381_g1885_i082450
MVAITLTSGDQISPIHRHKRQQSCCRRRQAKSLVNSFVITSRTERSVHLSTEEYNKALFKDFLIDGTGRREIAMFILHGQQQKIPFEWGSIPWQPLSAHFYCEKILPLIGLIKVAVVIIDYI